MFEPVQQGADPSGAACLLYLDMPPDACMHATSPAQADNKHPLQLSGQLSQHEYCTCAMYTSSLSAWLALSCAASLRIAITGRSFVGCGVVRLQVAARARCVLSVLRALLISQTYRAVAQVLLLLIPLMLKFIEPAHCSSSSACQSTAVIQQRRASRTSQQVLNCL